MPLSLRTTTLSATASYGGIRCYTKTADGDVREACNSTTETELLSALSSSDTTVMRQGDDWFPGELRFKASPDSSLCAVAWDAWFLSVFYQAEDGTLREKRHGSSWYDTDLVQDGVLSGTDLAAVHSSDGEKIILFFQNAEGDICYRRAQTGQWSPETIRLCKALKHCGLGAVSWNELEDIRVYYQEENFHIREHRGGFDSEWNVVEGFGFPYEQQIGDINAVGWSREDGTVELRLYLQNDNNNVIEWCNSGNGWYKGNLAEVALPEADIAAFIRKVATAYSVSVMWTGPDQVLYHKVFTGNDWLENAPIASLETAGRNVGSWVGKQFSDNIAHIDTKYIQKVRFNAGDIVDGFAIDYTDGTSTEWHGGRGGQASEFKLINGEDITQIQVCFDNKSICGLQFTTSQGRTSPWYGSKGERTQLWEQRGHALAGFIGAAEHFVHGLMPIWSVRLSEASPETLHDCIERAKRIGAEITQSNALIHEAEAKAGAYKSTIEERLKDPAETVMKGIAALVASIDYLQSLMEGLKNTKFTYSRPEREEHIRQTVATCKGKAVQVSEALKTLSETANGLASDGEQVAILAQLAKEARAMADRQRTLKDIEKVAAGFEANAKVSKAKFEADEVDARKRLAEKRTMLLELEKHKNDTKARKTTRDWLTLGVGNFFDLGGYNKHLRQDSQLVVDAERDLRHTQTNAAAARRSLEAVTADLALIAGLFATLQTDLTSLNSVSESVEALVEKNRALGQASKDLRGLVEQMFVSSEGLDDPFTPEQFAAGVLAIGGLADMSPELKGLMGDRPLEYQAALKAIVGSSDAVDA